MRWCFFDGQDRIEICDSPSLDCQSPADPPAERVELHEAWQAQRFVRRHFRDAGNLHRVRGLISAHWPLVHRLDEEAMLRLLAKRFQRAELYAFVSRPPPGPIPLCPVEAVPLPLPTAIGAPRVQNRPVSPVSPVSPVEARYWIEIELVGEDGKPIAGEAYTLKTVDGELIQGQLDTSGRARVETLTAAGDCQVSFPALDGAAWEFVQSQPGPA